MKNKTLAYDILNALHENNIITTDITWEKVKGGKVKVIDNSNYSVIFDLQNNVLFENEYDINDTEKHVNRKDKYSNYVALMRDDKSIIQLWGKANRGEVIIEFRKQLYDKLECDKLKVFRDCKHETYKGKEQNRLCVVDNTKDAIKVISAFVNRLESKTSTTETTADAKHTA